MSERISKALRTVPTQKTIKLYLKVTTDKYELPLAVAESPRELAMMCGTTANCVMSAISHHHKGWLKIEIGEEYEQSNSVE